MADTLRDGVHLVLVPCGCRLLIPQLVDVLSSPMHPKRAMICGYGLLLVAWAAFLVRPGIVTPLCYAAYLTFFACIVVSAIRQQRWFTSLLVAACYFGWPLLVAGGYTLYLYLAGHR